MKEKEYYAHSVEGKPPEQWQRLEDHLNGVAKTARRFADEFQTGDWGVGVFGGIVARPEQVFR